MSVLRYITDHSNLWLRSRMMWAGLALCALLIINACDTKEDVLPHQDQTFIKLFGGNGSEVGNDLLQYDGGYVLVGSTTSTTIPRDSINGDAIIGGKDIYVVCTNESGNVIWHRSFGGSGDDVGRSVILVDNHLYVCGEVIQKGENFMNLRDVYVLEISLETGVLTNHQSYGDPLRDEFGTSILNIQDGGFLITSTWLTTDTSDFFMVETYANLVALPNKQDYVRGTAGVHNFSATSFEINTNDPTYPPFVCFGSVQEFNTKKYLFQSFIYRPSNDKGIDPKRYGADIFDEYCTDTYPTTDGGFILSGYQEDGALKKREMVVKVDYNRNEIWKKVYVNAFDRSVGASKIIQTQDGGYLVSSKIEFEDQHGNDEISLLKLAYDGTMEWRQTFGSNENDEASRVIQLADGSYVMTGTMGFDINTNSESKMCLIKVNSEGELVPMN